MADKEKQYPVTAGIVCLRDFFSSDVSLFNALGNKEHYGQNAENKYIIPFYQRPYQWSDKELQGLFDACITLPQDDNQLELIDDYVIFGTIQLNETDKGFEIIDGQQRLTSFWLFIKAIESVIDDFSDESDKLLFNVKNNISDILNDQFENFEKAAENKENKYAENYDWLKVKIEDIKNKFEKDVFDAKQLKESILKHVLFSLMITTYKDNVHKSIKLFDALNTKGLDLGVKDVFKINFYEYINKNEKSEISKIFEKINSSYEKCKDDLESIYQIDENDLLDTFKLWIILNDNKGKELANKVKASPQSFFVEGKYKVWQTYDESKSLDTFVGIAETINQTQKMICNLDKIGPSDNFSASLLSTVELSRECGYWYFRNMTFVLAHFARMNNKSCVLEETDLLQVLKIGQLLWKVCSVIKVRDYRVVNDVLTSIPNIFIKGFKDGNLSYIEKKLKDFFKEKNNEGEEYRKCYIDELNNIINGNIFDNRQCHFFVDLMYMDDCDNFRGEFSWEEQKEKLFYLSSKEGKNRKYEIEHIASHVFERNEELSEYVNHIGNLVFLSGNINKALGKHTADIDTKDENGLVKDFNAKIKKGSSFLNYWNEVEIDDDKASEKKVVNLSIKMLLDALSQNEQRDYKQIIEFIQDRDREKQQVLKNVYRDFIGD